MVIQHNFQMAFASRQLNMTTSKIGKLSEKLNSGYRINRAADDAAGLSISEKMRMQIRGLTRASQNIQDGISLLNVADGAMEGVVSIMQRQRELIVQGANGTNADSDKAAIQSEIDELTKEVDRIFSSTDFNSVKIFKKPEVTLNEYDEYDTKSGILSQTNSGRDPAGSETNTVALYSETDGPAYVDGNGLQVYETRKKTTTTTYTTTWDATSTTKSYSSDIKTHVIEHRPDYIMIQAGSQSNQSIGIRMYDLSASDFYLDTLDVSDIYQAGASLSNIDEGLNQLLSIRSYYGAMTNRLEHTINNNDNTAENLQYAESRIRDTEMASTMVQYSKENILLQATQAIMAQAKSDRDGVMALLNSL